MAQLDTWAWYSLNEQVARFERSDGPVGYGMHEYGVFGAFPKFGLTRRRRRGGVKRLAHARVLSSPRDGGRSLEGCGGQRRRPRGSSLLALGLAGLWG